MRDRTSVTSAVTGAEVHRVCAERELDRAGDHEQKLFRVAVRVLLGSRRSSGIDLPHEYLELLERPRLSEHKLLTTVGWQVGGDFFAGAEDGQRFRRVESLFQAGSSTSNARK